MATDQVMLKYIPVDPTNWRTVNQNAPIPLQQHPVYGLALQTFGATATQVLMQQGSETIGLALLVYRKLFKIIDFTSVFRGPLWYNGDTDVKLKLACMQALKAEFSPWRWNFMTVQPEEAASEQFIDTLRKGGLKQVMTGFSTAWIDLRQDELTLRANLAGKWRNQLVKAEKSNLLISVGGRKSHQYDWLLGKEALQRTERQYQATPLGLVPAFLEAATPRSGCGVTSVSAVYQKRRIAGALFLLHGNSATYHIGWASEEARNLNAQNRVLWEGILALKEKGVKFLDLGGLNTAQLAGIARFKLGTGAKPHTLAGSFL